MTEIEKTTYEKIARMARAEAEQLAPRGVGVGIVQVGEAVALRRFASKLETEAQRGEGAKILCSLCKNEDKPLTDGEFQTEGEVQYTPAGPVHADCFYGQFSPTAKEGSLAFRGTIGSGL